MAARRRKKSPIAIVLSLLIIVLAGVFAALQGCDINIPGLDLGKKNEMSNPALVPEDGEVIFHFMDVGQGDAILVTTPDGNMLVDTSIQGARDELVAYLESAGVKELKYLVLTHPDADHIGNADYIIDNYKVANILLPNYASTSKTYERMLDAMERSDANIINPEPGYTFNLGALQNTVIAPNEEYGDPNEMSIVFKSVYGETSVMMTGDAEVESEGDIVKKWKAEDLKSTILKVGHHGSSTSTTDAFLAAVDPKIAVISCGEDNKYGHPHVETVEKLTAKGVKIHRTDKEGTIVYKTDGKSFTLVQE